jgi:hypothetical protein
MLEDPAIVADAPERVLETPTVIAGGRRTVG